MSDFSPETSSHRTAASPTPSSGGSGESARLSGPVSYGVAFPSAPAAEGFFQILLRRWVILVSVVVLALVVGVFYIALTRPVYTSKSVLLVQPSGPQVIGANGENQATSEAAIESFLNTQCQVVISTPVLALALPRLQQTRTLSGVARQIEYLKKYVTVEPGKHDATISVSFDSPYPEEGNLIVGSIVDSFRDYQSTQWKNSAKDVLDILESGQKRHQQDLEEKSKRMLEVAGQLNMFVGPDDKAGSQVQEQVRSIADALTKTRMETLTAKNAFDSAAKSILGDDEKLRQVADLEKSAAYTNPSLQLTTIQTELFQYQTRLNDALRNYMPSHPIVKTIQARIDQLTVQSVAASEQWYLDCALREEQLQKSLDQAQSAALEQVSKAAEYRRLQDDVDRIRKMDDLVDARIKSVDLTRAAGAMNISVLDPAQVTEPPKPSKSKALALSLVLGLIGGLAVACTVDFLDDRIRTPEAIRSSMGLAVLGAVPQISTGYTAADRGQTVMNEPGSAVAEAFRTLRTGLKFGLPKGAKTILITSPVAGDGKSTMASNLGIALAQSGLRVLIVDADFRAPMQHHLFGLRDRAGLATVLQGKDTLDRAIQRAELERLDILPCGPMPENPAELLNDPAFNERILELADKYDLVIVDAPPVLAVADARIVAASCDETLLVLRIGRSTRKQAEEAVMGLRSVGAHLAGILANGVMRSAHHATINGNYGGRYAPRDTGLAGLNQHPQSSARQPITPFDAITGSQSHL